MRFLILYVSNDGWNNRRAHAICRIALLPRELLPFFVRPLRGIRFDGGDGLGKPGDRREVSLTLKNLPSLRANESCQINIRKPSVLSPIPQLEECYLGSPAHLTSSRAIVIKPILAEEISENPRCSGNREGFGGFAPIRMTVGIRKKQRYPHE